MTGSYDGWLMITGLITSSLVVPAKQRVTVRLGSRDGRGRDRAAAATLILDEDIAERRP